MPVNAREAFVQLADGVRDDSSLALMFSRIKDRVPKPGLEKRFQEGSGILSGQDHSGVSSHALEMRQVRA